MPASALASALDLPFICTSSRGIFGMTRTLEDAQQHCQQAATSPLDWSRRGRRWTGEDTRTGLIYSIEQLLF